MKFFNVVDKFKPVYDMAYKVILFICKILLIADIGITSMAVLGRYVSFIPDPSWSEEIVLTLMAYMAVLSATLAIRRGTHIRMTALDKVLSPMTVRIMSIIADVGVLILGYIMLHQGWIYASTIGAVGKYISMPKVSKIWLYLPVPIAGAAMIIFELEALYNHVKSFFVKEEKPE